MDLHLQLKSIIFWINKVFLEFEIINAIAETYYRAICQNDS